MGIKKLLQFLTDRNAKAKYYWRVISLLAMVGVVVSGYLLKLEHKYATSTDTFCDFSDKFSCSTVAASKYSELLGLPVALWGVVAYLIMVVVAHHFSKAKKISKQMWSAWLIFVIGSLAFSLYLTYAELFIIKSVCIFCVTQQIVILLIAGFHWPIIKSDHRI